MRKRDGFSLVELMVAMVVFVFVIVAATQMLIPLVGQFKQQSRIAETNIESIAGLEMLRADLEQAGFGLPWSFPGAGTLAYGEATVAPANSVLYKFNDTPYPPRAVAAYDAVAFAGPVNGNAGTTKVVTGSDYLVIKSTSVTSVTGSDTAMKWTYLPAGAQPVQWNYSSWDLNPTDNVIVINPVAGTSPGSERQLVMNGAAFSTTFSFTSFPAGFSPTPSPTPTTSPQYFYIFGVGTVPLLRPFNRADYYVGIPTAAAKPVRCATGTGVLYKSILSQGAGTFPAATTMPLLDCVADMQVVFGLDMNTTKDGIIGTYSNANGSFATDASTITGQSEGATAASIQQVLQPHLDLSDYRNSLLEVRIYVLAHEGQADPGYMFNGFTGTTGTGGCGTCVRVGELDTLMGLGVGADLGRNFNLALIGDTNWQHYRWKVYKLIVKLYNTR